MYKILIRITFTNKYIQNIVIKQNNIQLGKNNFIKKQFMQKKHEET